MSDQELKWKLAWNQFFQVSWTNFRCYWPLFKRIVVIADAINSLVTSFSETIDKVKRMNSQDQSKTLDPYASISMMRFSYLESVPNLLEI